jgi:hypothetical protein
VDSGAAAPRPARRTGGGEARAAAVVAVAEAPAPALSGAVLGELRGALRGCTSAEVAEALSAPVQQVEAALRALVAQGAAVPRGPRFYVS